MGTAAPALAAALGLVLAARPARADDCVGHDARGSFATCFDLGNRLVLEASTRGVSAGIALRHIARFADEVSWRLEHELASVTSDDGDLAGVLYRGRFLRHARDGHIVLPLGLPKKVFLPFDLGAEAEVGRVELPADGQVEVGVIRTALLAELTRADSFRHRVTIGPVTRWDLTADVETRDVVEHRVAPFSLGALDLAVESAAGLTRAHGRLEAGAIWSTVDHWRGSASAEAEVERVVLAINDRPLSVFAQGRWDAGEPHWSGFAGLRFAPLVGEP